MLTRITAGLMLSIFTLAAAAAAPESLLIGPGDLVHIQVAGTPEMDQHPRVTDAGEILVTGAGMVRVSGLAPPAAAEVVRDRLIAARYMIRPEVMVSIDQYATQGVSVLGEVKAAGSYPIATSRSILDILALAGGLNAVADRNIIVERHGNPAVQIHYHYSNDSERAIADQVMVNPGDTVLVAKTGIVYVIGDVNHPGGFVMANNESAMTMLQAIAAAGGLTKSAKQGRVRLIHKVVGGTYFDRTLSVASLQEGKIPDIELQPGDVVYVPFSFGRNLATFGAASIAAAATSASIYALP